MLGVSFLCPSKLSIILSSWHSWETSVQPELRVICQVCSVWLNSNHKQQWSVVHMIPHHGISPTLSFLFVCSLWWPLEILQDLCIKIFMVIEIDHHKTEAAIEKILATKYFYNWRRNNRKEGKTLSGKIMCLLLRLEVNIFTKFGRFGIEGQWS
jgi:hypothetical protein